MMKMDEFAEIIKGSNIAGNRKTEIIYLLLQYAGAKESVSMSARGVPDHTSNRSPSTSTIQNWLSEKGSPRVSSFFPEGRIVNGEQAHDFFRNKAKTDQWIVLRERFREWRKNNQKVDDFFCINTETDDLITFSTSFWRQFASYFNLSMWDVVEEQHSETESGQKSSNGKIINEMIGVFKEKFMEYKFYKIIPKDIRNIIDSLYIYRKILDENTERIEHESIGAGSDTIKKMYCKWFDNEECFIFYAATCSKFAWKVETPEGYILLKFDKSFEIDEMPTNTWMIRNFKYAVVDSRIPEGGQFDDEVLPWKECQGEIIIIDIPIKARASVNEGTATNEKGLIDDNYPIIEDCYVFIDRMLALDSSIEEFMVTINEKIIKKYEGILFNDTNSRILYNDITQYRKSLKKFKECLNKFRNLQKEKSEYINAQMLIKSFEAYSAFSDFKASPKPTFPFSECYLDPVEASKVESELYHFHGNLRELYASIFSYKVS